MLRPTRLLALSMLLLAPLAATAQEVPPLELPDIEAPAHISVVDGAVTLEREGHSETAVANMPLLEGDRLESSGGRVEVAFPDGSTLHLDEFSAIDLLSGNLLRLLRGRVIVYAAGRQDARPDFDFQVDTPAGSVRLLMPGQYRVSLFSGPEVELAVVRGEAALATSRASSQARTGERVYAREDEAPSRPMAFNSARWDAFEQWSDQQRQAVLGGDSTAYLPDEVDRYAYLFDQHGSWRSLPDHGWVWYPRVEVDWRPYYRGYWHPFESLGWFWIGYDPWGWPTHHYGRWGFDSGWYWIPHRRFGPGWVSWGVSVGHVGWCPLGWDHRPLVSLFVDNHYYGGRLHDPWRAWTVIPRRAFGARVGVSSVAIVGSSLDASVRRSFIVQHASPPMASRAVPRPIGAAGRAPAAVGRAVPRGGGGGTAVGPPAGTFRGTQGNQRTAAPAPRAGVPGQAESRPGRDRDYWPDRRASGSAPSQTAGAATRRAPPAAVSAGGATPPRSRGGESAPRSTPPATRSAPAPTRSAPSRQGGSSSTGRVPPSRSGSGSSIGRVSPSTPRSTPPATRSAPAPTRSAPSRQGGSSSIGRAPSGPSRSGSPGRTSSGSSGRATAGGRARPRNGRQ